MTTSDLAVPARSAVPRPRRGLWGRGLRNSLTGWLFVAPATIIVLGLSIFPAGWALLLSFQKWDGFSEAQLMQCIVEVSPPAVCFGATLSSLFGSTRVSMSGSVRVVVLG